MSKTLQAGLVYFAIVLGTGFVLGVFRVLFLVPRIGERWAELAEMPIMATVIFIAAGFILRRFPAIGQPGRSLMAGVLALVLLVAVELVLATVLQDRSLAEFIVSRDKVSGSVYIAALLVFAVMPRLRLKSHVAARMVTTTNRLHQRRLQMKNNPVVHFEIYVEDMTRAKAFYEAVLDTKLEQMPNPTPEIEMEMWFFPMDQESGMSSYGAGGALVAMDNFAPGGGGTLVYFACDDCALQATRAAEHGGSLFQEKMSIGEHGFCALARDTEGNLIGFHSMK